MNKKIFIYLIVSLMLITNVLAYGGGSSYVPTPVSVQEAITDFTVEFGQIDEDGQSISLTNPDFVVSGMNINTKEKQEKVEININKISNRNKPSNSEVYQSFEIKTSMLESYIDAVELELAVSKEWIENNEGTLYLFHEKDNNWVKEDLAEAGEDGNYKNYKAKINSFSKFAVGIEKPIQETKVVEETKSEEKGMEEIVGAVIGEEGTSNKKWFYGLGVLFLLIVAVIGGILYKNNRKLKLKFAFLFF